MFSCDHLHQNSHDLQMKLFTSRDAQKLLDGEQCRTLRVLLDGRAESAQLLQDRCQQIGQLLQEAAAAPDYAAGCVTLHRKVGACAQTFCYSVCHLICLSFWHGQQLLHDWRCKLNCTRVARLTKVFLCHWCSLGRLT